MPSGSLTATLHRFFTRTVPLVPQTTVLVAFSAGPDSTALLHAMARLGRQRDLRVVAAHLDHGLDPDSARRAVRARSLASRIGVPFVSDSLGTVPPPRHARGLEDWARSQRYAFLERQRRLHHARFTLTAHHRDDQVETILLRLLLGSGLEGLAGMEQRRDPLLRPLLDLPGAELLDYLARTGLEAAIDPTNIAGDRPRSRLRHGVLPSLRRREAAFDKSVLRLARAARSATLSTQRRVAHFTRPRSTTSGAALDLEALRALPGTLWPFALSRLHAAAGLDYPASSAARAELRRQLGRSGRVDCDCGDGWHWIGRGQYLELVSRETAPDRFTYTLSVPGELRIPESEALLSVRRERMAPWMLEGRRARAAMDLPLARGDTVVVRSRSPGDRIRPLGCAYTKRLKEVLIDRKVPRNERDRLPLLCLGDRIAWVPGITIDDSFRLTTGSRPWVARLDPL